VPFFANGTMICTLSGEKPVERIEVGDRVVTRDNGLQTVRQVYCRDYDFGQITAARHLQPVLVSAGALGPSLPERDMLVSPNQRLLPDHKGDLAGADDQDRLVAAKNLIDNRTIRTCSVLGVRYVHFEFARHEVVLANGVWAECFNPEDMSLGAQGNAQRTEIFDIYPERKPAPALRKAADA